MKKDTIVIFPIVITPTNEKIKYSVYIPDLKQYTQGQSITEAIEMSKDSIGSLSLVEALPANNTHLPKVKDSQIATLVTVNISEYKRKNDNKVIKKTLTIPNYLNEQAKDAGINFSQLLTEALQQKLNV